MWFSSLNFNLRKEYYPYSSIKPSTMASNKKAGEASAAINESSVYHNIEPYCEWKRGQDLLILHVPEFRKEQLKVQVNPSGTLKISGERPMETKAKARFKKEIRVHPESCNLNDIQAKLSNGKLTITFPRQSPGPVRLPASTSVEPPSRTGGCSVLETVLGKCGVEGNKEDDELRFGRFKVGKKVVVGVGVAVVLAIGVLVVLKPSSSSSTNCSSSSSDSFMMVEE